MRDTRRQVARSRHWFRRGYGGGGCRLVVFRLAYDGCKCRQLAHVTPEHLAVAGYEAESRSQLPGPLVAEFLSICLEMGYLCDESQVTSRRDLEALQMVGRQGYGGRFKDKLMRPFSAIQVHPDVTEHQVAAALRPLLFDDAFGEVLFRLRQPGRVIPQDHLHKQLGGYASASMGVHDADVTQLTKLLLDRAGGEFESKNLLSWAEREDMRLRNSQAAQVVSRKDFEHLLKLVTKAFDKGQPARSQAATRSRPGLRLVKLDGNHRKEVKGADIYRTFSQDNAVFPVFMTGVFNPFGPTLTIGVVILQNDGMLAHALVTLNPFSCQTDTTHAILAGQLQLTPGEIKVEVADDVPRFSRKGRAATGLDDALGLGLLHQYPEEADVAPFTIFRASRHIEAPSARAHLTVALSRLKEASKVLDNLRDAHMRTSPFDRVNPEALGRPMPQGRRLALKEAEELAQLIDNPEQQAVELKAMLLAWEGSIQMSGSGRERCACTSEDLLKILLTLSDDFPGLLHGIAE